MDIKDITKEQLETLIMIKSLEEFVTDEHENLSSLSEVIWTLEESLSNEEHKQLVTDICKLTETGYILSDGTEGHIEIDRIPEVEGITPKGQSALDDWEKEIRGSIDKGENESSDIHLHLSLLGGVTINNSLLSISDSLFGSIGNIVKELLHI